MTVFISPAAEINLEETQGTAESIEARISGITELISSAEIIYDNNQQRMDTMDNNRFIDLENGPWRNSYAETPAGGGTVNFGPDTNSAWDFVFTSPIRDIYYSASPSLAAALPGFIPNYNGGRYDSIFRQHKQRLNIPGGLKDSINNAVSQLNNLNTIGYQSQLEQARNIIAALLIEELELFRDIINIVSTEINNPQSIIYKPGSPYGPFSTAQIAAFTMPGGTEEVVDGIEAIITILRNVYQQIDELINIPQDVLTRVTLVNAGLTQSPNDPNQFNLLPPEEKDPWGIRFSYKSSQSANLYARNNQVNQFANNPTGHSITAANSTERQQELQASRELLEAVDINMQKDFYFQLLPAIKTNMPSSGSTDVPGAMPGIQFRIENNIVKHKIPGFAPIYQPIGIDCIKCTLVGMFTGHDGVDLSRAYSDDISAGLLAPGGSMVQGANPFTSGHEYSLATGGPTLSTFQGSSSPFAPTSLQLPTNNNGFDIPIPAQSKSKTASPVAVLSEDAFRGAQDFYNEIVSQGREVEVELNLRKGSGPFPGGTPGPFRDPETGNPRFKGLIRRLDLYYTRRDRCWFIIDLEITDSGLIGDECINLTNIIEESVNLFEGVVEPLGLTKEQLDKCFKDPVEFTLKGQRTGQSIVIDKATGLSYFYIKNTDKLATDRTYPMGYEETQRYLYASRTSEEIEDPKSDYIKRSGPPGLKIGSQKSRKKRLAGLMLELASLYEPTLTDKDNDLANNWFPSVVGSFTFNGLAWRYNKNNGKFYLVYQSNGNLAFNSEESERYSGTLKELISSGNIDFNDNFIDDNLPNFIVSDWNPLLNIPDNDCNKLLDQLEQEQFNKQQNAGEKAIGESREGSSVEYADAESVDPIQQGGDISPLDPNLQPTFITTQDNNQDQNLELVKEGVENGALDRLINQALNEYTKALDRDRLAYVGTALSPDYNQLLTNEAFRGNVFIADPDGVVLSLVEGRTRVNSSNTNNSEISIRVKYTFDKKFYLVSGNTSRTFDPAIASRVYRDADVIVKAYIKDGVKVYKVDGISLDTIYTRGNRVEPTPVQAAPTNQQPSDNNQPSAFFGPQQPFVGPSIDVTTAI